jgi:Uma2 family endonuclease
VHGVGTSYNAAIMSTIPTRPVTRPASDPSGGDKPELTWEIAELFPPQGMWTEEEYLALGGNRLVEFSDGRVEVLALPTELHQMIVAFLFEALLAWARPRDAGKVLFSALRVRLRPGKVREPDVVFMRKENDHRRGNEFWDGADLVMEVVSDDDRRRDLVIKRFEYAQAGIPEYWIIDPKNAEVTVLKLAGELYTEHGVFARGQQATSATLDGFTVDVTALFSVK